MVGVIIVASPRSPHTKNEDAEISQQQEISESNQVIKPITGNVKKAYAAGSFYPKDPINLNTQLETYFQKTQKIETSGKPRILIMPHAGIQYSGETSAWSAKQLEGEDFSKVVIMGVSHKYSYDYAAVYSESAWETPLGTMNINTYLASKLISDKNKVISDESKHQEDHNLEVPLIYIQKVSKNFEILPIMIGNQASEETLNYLAFELASLMDDETILIISTDLSHYPSWEDARKSDRRVIDALVTGNESEFKRAVKANAANKYREHSTSACGFNAIVTGLKIAEILNFDEIKELHSVNSGDVTGDKSRVVGYTSVVFWSDDIPIISLNEKAKKEALKLARDSVNTYFDKEELNYAPANSDLLLPIGAFVTLTKNGDLRGCIGNFEPEEPLYKVLQNVAVSAAVRDGRFTPVTKDEFKELDIEISTMSPQKLIKNWQDIEIGKHGVRIILNGKSGTLLPKVATDNNWGLETFLETICWQKMGLEDKSCYKNPNAQIFVYETDVFSESDYK